MTAKHNTTITDAEIIGLAGDRGGEARELIAVCHTHVRCLDGQTEGQFVWRKRSGVMGLTLVSCGQFLTWAECEESTILGGLFEIAFNRTGRFGPVCQRSMKKVLSARARDDSSRTEKVSP